MYLHLTDGSPLTIDVFPTPALPLSGWLPAVLILRLVMIAGCCWLAVRVATRPLNALANAADAPGPGLREMESLVKEGGTYAGTLHGASEAPCKVDLDALLDSLVCDYADAGSPVTLE